MPPQLINKISISPKYSDKVNVAADKVLMGNNIIDYIVDVANLKDLNQ